MSELINCSNSCNKSANAAAATAAAVLRRSHGSVVNWDAIVFLVFIICLLCCCAAPRLCRLTEINQRDCSSWLVGKGCKGWMARFSFSFKSLSTQRRLMTTEPGVSEGESYEGSRSEWPFYLESISRWNSSLPLSSRDPFHDTRGSLSWRRQIATRWEQGAELWNALWAIVSFPKTLLVPFALFGQASLYFFLLLLLLLCPQTLVP